MVTLFSQEKVDEIREYNIRKQERAAGRLEMLLGFVQSMSRRGFSVDEIAQVVEVSEDEVRAILATGNQAEP